MRKEYELTEFEQELRTGSTEQLLYDFGWYCGFSCGYVEHIRDKASLEGLKFPAHIDGAHVLALQVQDELRKRGVILPTRIAIADYREAESIST